MTIVAPITSPDILGFGHNGGGDGLNETEVQALIDTSIDNHNALGAMDDVHGLQALFSGLATTLTEVSNQRIADGASARRHMSGTQAIGQSTFTPLSLDVLEHDEADFSIDGDPTYFTVPWDGYYIAYGAVEFALDANDNGKMVAIYTNEGGSDRIIAQAAHSGTSAGNVNARVFAATGPVSLTAGSRVWLSGWCNQPGGVTIESSSDTGATFLGIQSVFQVAAP